MAYQVPGDFTRLCPDCPSIGGRHPNPFELAWLVQFAPEGAALGAPGRPPGFLVTPGARPRPDTGHVNGHDLDWFRAMLAVVQAQYIVRAKAPRGSLADPERSGFFGSEQDA